MLLELALSAASAFGIGFTTVLLLWPGIERANLALLAVKTFLAIGIGQGITACSTFLFLLVHGSLDRSYCFYELLGLIGLLGVLVRTRRATAAPASHAGSPRVVSHLPHDWILAVALCVAVAAALGALLIWMHRAPYGGWDAWAIYNLRARSIYRGGYDWQDAFSQLLVRSHLDYPLLLPLSVVRAWIYAGSETMLAPRLIGGLFGVAIVGLLCSAVAALRGRAQAYLAGVALLGNVFLVQHTSSQYADVPLTFFYLAAVSLFVLCYEITGERNGGPLLVTGLAAGLAAWTKNEGLLFLVVTIGAHLMVLIRRVGWKEYARELRLLAIGFLPVLLIVIYFKSRIAPPSSLATLVSVESLAAKIIDPSRYWEIASELVRRIVPEDGFALGVACALALYGLCAGLGARRSKGVALAALILFLLLMGYFAVYVITPHPLRWHLFTSIDRVLLQLWPTFVFVFFLVVATPQEIFRSSVAPGAARG